MVEEMDYRVNAVNPEHDASRVFPNPKRKKQPGERERRTKKQQSDQDADEEIVDENIEDQNDEKKQDDDHAVDYYA